jgi:hypothetical protein
MFANLGGLVGMWARVLPAEGEEPGLYAKVVGWSEDNQGVASVVCLDDNLIPALALVFACEYRETYEAERENAIIRRRDRA